MDTHAVDVVLVDLRAHGFVNLIAIRMDSRVPVVVVTRGDTPIDLSGDGGRTCAIATPFGIEDLVDTLARVVASDRAAAARPASSF